MHALWLALLLSLSSVALGQEACECVWRGSFDKVQGGTSLVVSGTVLGRKGNSLDLQIDRRLRGTEYKDDIRIWMQTANYCRPPVDDFPDGTQWVMALNHIEDEVPGGFNPNTPNMSYGRVGDYILSSCGGYWLKQTGDWVTGNLVNQPRWDREPKMTPVLLDLVAEFVAGSISAEALETARKEDPALRELRLNTRAFLRGQAD